MCPVIKCPNCGIEQQDVAEFCSNCGTRLPRIAGEQIPGGPTGVPATKSAIDALTRSAGIIAAKPMVLAPALIGGIVSAVLSGVASGAVGVVLTLLGAIVSYILGFASMDMARDAYLNKELNLSESVSYVIGRIGLFIVASVVGAILAIVSLGILIPVVVLMFVIIVVDETGIGNGISRAFGVLSRRLLDVLIIFVVSIVASVLLGLVPIVGTFLVAIINVLIALALIHVYYDYKRSQT
jgi:hypothetical protein